MWLHSSMCINTSIQSPPAGWESSQSIPPEAMYTSLAAISKSVPVWERSFCWPTAPALFASEELKRLEKSECTPTRTLTHTNIQLLNQCCSLPIFCLGLRAPPFLNLFCTQSVMVSGPRPWRKKKPHFLPSYLTKWQSHHLIVNHCTRKKMGPGKIVLERDKKTFIY